MEVLGMFKKLAGITLSVGILFGGFTSPASANNSDQAHEDLIQKRFELIDSKYKIGEPFNKADSDFVKANAKLKATKPGEFTTMARDSLYINKSGGAGNISANMNGYVWGQMGYINHSYGAYFSTKVTKGSATKITNSVYTTAYGAIGSNGYIGQIYTGKETDFNEDKDYLYSDMDDSYTGLAVYQRVYAKTVVTNGTYTFTIKSGNL
jgi:hypothetical protein